MSLKFSVVALLAGGLLPAQTPKPPSLPGLRTLDNGLRVARVAIPAAADVSIALTLPTGWDHDPPGRTGCAEVMRWTLRLAQRDGLPAERFEVEVHSRQTMVWVSCPKRDAVDRLAFIAEVLSLEFPVSDDLAAVAVARARLRSDDHAWLFPGSVIEQKAWRTLLRGEPGGRQRRGCAEELIGLDRRFLADRLRDHYGPTGACLVVIGDVDDEVWKPWMQRCAALPRSLGAPPLTVHDGAPELVATAGHDRIDGCFVTAAIRAPEPDAPDYLAFVVGMVALRTEAMSEFGRFRGMEWKARFPFVSFEAWKGDRVALINRRGENGALASSARREIEGLLRRVRGRRLSRRVVEQSRQEVALTMAVPPFATTSGPYLSVRARYLATALLAGWPLDRARRVGALSFEDVQRVMAERLRPADIKWFVLHPTRKPAEPLEQNATARRNRR